MPKCFDFQIKCHLLKKSSLFRSCATILCGCCMDCDTVLWSKFSNWHYLSEQLFQGREDRRLCGQYVLNWALWSVYRGVTHCTKFVACLIGMQSNPNIVPLFVHCNLWQYIEGDGMSKYCVIGNFCSSTSICAKWGRCLMAATVYIKHCFLLSATKQIHVAVKLDVHKLPMWNFSRGAGHLDWTFRDILQSLHVNARI